MKKIESTIINSNNSIASLYVLYQTVNFNSSLSLYKNYTIYLKLRLYLLLSNIYKLIGKLN